MENIKKPETFEDLLELQKRLDKEIEKPRDNGFIPKERDYSKIVKSMIAEIIEFNEETKNTHKTWKQKVFDREKMVEESSDILFFFLQLCNLVNDKDEKIKKMLSDGWENAWLIEELFELFGDKEDIELLLINKLSDISWNLSISMCFNVLALLVCLYMENEITKQEILDTYWNKWQKNMERINKDWSLK